jgi:hypothetical protein
MSMRHASEVGVADDIETAIPDVADVPLRDLRRMRNKVAESALESVLSRLVPAGDAPADEAILPFGSYLP